MNRQRLSSITTRIKTPSCIPCQTPWVRVRDYLPLQQGLRQHVPFQSSTLWTVRDYLPLQQGLRPISINPPTIFCSQRLSSITTRIKTFTILLSHTSTSRQRLSSITTRIKTSSHPPTLRVRGRSQRLSSITTRIKTFIQYLDAVLAVHSQRLSSITTRIKTSSFNLNKTMSAIVRDYLPLQQGLRPRRLCNKRLSGKCQRLSSITTRIKTFLATLLKMVSILSETIFHYNKD